MNEGREQYLQYQQRGPGGTGGSRKLKSSKDDSTLRGLRKGDPLHKCCGKKVRDDIENGGVEIVVYLKWGSASEQN